MKIYFSMLLLGVTIIMLSCKEECSLLEFDKSVFNYRFEQWRKNDFRNYEFTQKYNSSTVGKQPSIKTLVKNKKNLIFEVLGDDPTSIGLVRFKHIPDLFNFITQEEQIIKKEIESQNSSLIKAFIKVKYDDTYHFPTEIKIEKQNHDSSLDYNLIIKINDFKNNVNI